MPLTTADCNALSDLFTRESGRIAPTLQKRMTGKSLFLDRIKRGPFPDGMGTTISVLTVERSFTTDADDAAWTAVTASTGTGNGTCLPTSSALTFGQTPRTFALYRKALESPDICLEDLRTDFQINQQLGASIDSLTGAVQWELEKHAINQYIALMPPGNILNVNSAMTPNVTTGVFVSGPPPTSPLTQGVLDAEYVKIMRDSFGDGAAGRAGAAYVFTLVCSPETSRNLIKQNADIRQDWRYAFMGDKMESPLLQGYGVDRSYGNYAHYIVPHMPRYDLVANVMTRRNYWTQSSTTKGYKYEVSSTYLAAAYEVSIIFNEKVYEWLVPGSINAPGGTTRFNTPDYFPASVTWKNIPDRVCNPDGTIGFFRAVLASASMPVHPEYGRVFLHLRCGPSLDQQACD
jgi:hypothetical protein